MERCAPKIATDFVTYLILSKFHWNKMFSKLFPIQDTGDLRKYNSQSIRYILEKKTVAYWYTPNETTMDVQNKCIPYSCL
jgi:hypothetical protein